MGDAAFLANRLHEERDYVEPRLMNRIALVKRHRVGTDHLVDVIDDEPSFAVGDATG